MRTEEQDRRIVSLKEAIFRAFPAEPYAGKVTVSDDILNDPEMGAEKELHDGLQGQRWTDIPAYLSRRAEDTFGLLTDDAYPAFLAAWLTYALEDMDGENEVRDCLVYSFQTMRQFRTLNADQRLVVRSFLLEIKDGESSEFIQEHAAQALALIDRGRY